MKMNLIVSGLMMVVGMAQANAGNHDPRVIASLLKNAKFSLLDGIELAERHSGTATSAKFEVSDDGKLELSIYTVPEGLGVEPEKASLTEVSGDATQYPFKPKVEVFTDKEHIARATVHMTLFQLSGATLKQVIQRAMQRASGVPIDVRNPMVRGGRAVADVVIVDYDRNVSVVTVDLLSGRTRLRD